MLVGIQDEILRLHAKGLLAPLLVDKTTKRNIIWATDAYRALGFPYERTQEILPALITGEHSDVIKTRARKEMEQQSERTRRHAEVFTSLAVCRQMIGDADAAYFGGVDPFMVDGVPSVRVSFPRRRKWQHYVDARRLEITCGEAPYLVHRYDLATMESVPLAERQGILDRKLRVVTENTADETAWMKWALRAYQATYGYEFQGDNLLIARVNLLMTFEEYLRARWRRKPTEREYRAIVRTIVWNLWQMDGIRGTIPCVSAEHEPMELPLFELPEDVETFSLFPAHTQETAAVRIYDWRRQSGLEYRRVNTGGRTMKFDFVIGNPPYQEERQGTSTTALPVYHSFMESSYQVADRVELITPARFLFNAGRTSKAWNEKMLNDPHLKVLLYEKDASNFFPNTEIKGGVVITYYDRTKDFGAIETFTIYDEVNNIVKKVREYIKEEGAFSSKTFVATKFDLVTLVQDYAQYEGRERRMSSNVLPFECFHEERVDNDIMVYGVLKGRRCGKFIHRKYVDMSDDNITKYKIVTPKADGNGVFGDTLTNPEILEPNSGFTHTFLGIGGFSDKLEAEQALKYIKTKFVRALLSVLKVTQDLNADKWKYVPLQDFTSSSDIDWSQSIAEIDRQLYAKYGLSAEEIAFIESHVKEMS